MSTNDDASSDPQPSDASESKIVTDEVKQRHTTHWDRDYLPSDAIEEAYEEGAESSQEEKKDD